jgi:hypothetical protein
MFPELGTVSAMNVATVNSLAEGPGFTTTNQQEMNTTRKNKFGMLALACAAASVSSAFGYTVTLTQTSFSSGSGGEFTAKVNDNSLAEYIASYDQAGAPNSTVGVGSTTNGTFQTFCIEHVENFYPGQPYTVIGITASAKAGGMAVSDHLSIGTAFLYSEFAKGTLAGYNYDLSSRSASAGALQNTIWWLENEIAGNSGVVPKPSNSFTTLVETMFGAVGVQHAGLNGDGGGAAKDAADGQYGVWALNLGVGVQDQLIYKATGNTDVPDGGTTLMLLGLGMTGMVSIRRLVSARRVG